MHIQMRKLRWFEGAVEKHLRRLDTETQGAPLATLGHGP